MDKKISMILTEEEWIKVIQLVESKCDPSFNINEWNKFNSIKTKLLFQLGANK
jgi:hypothetical protein